MTVTLIKILVAILMAKAVAAVTGATITVTVMLALAVALLIASIVRSMRIDRAERSAGLLYCYDCPIIFMGCLTLICHPPNVSETGIDAYLAEIWFEDSKSPLLLRSTYWSSETQAVSWLERRGRAMTKLIDSDNIAINEESQT